MQRIACALWRDDSGFVVSAELALVSTMATLGMVSGLAEASHNVNQEMRDVGAAYGRFDQSFSCKNPRGQIVTFSDSDRW
ncbi:MAG: branched-chain amino acid aminotransferase [Planctomycetota bacterium]|jgi:hypothetical protein|nr:MAG: branched-chain amino acid aminotransferase [Planctomycetota bacterium]